jgi:hypothetical protein
VEIFSGIFVSGFLSHQKVTIPPWATLHDDNLIRICNCRPSTQWRFT